MGKVLETREAKYEISQQARAELVKRYAKEKDVLNWGRVLFPEKFTKPFSVELHQYMIDIRIEKFTDTLAPRGHGKCASGDSVVLCEYGTKRIDELVVGDVIYSLNAETNKIDKQRVLGRRGGQYKKGYKVKTKSGREVKISDNHRMYTYDGYKEIEDIHLGDYFGCLNTEIDSGYEINDNELKFITYMIFKGSCGSSAKNDRCRSFSNADKYVVSDFKEVLKCLGLYIAKKTPYSVDYPITTKCIPLLEKYNIDSKTCKEKRLPSDFFGMSLRQKVLFLSIMLDADGYYQLSAGNWGISLANEGLIDDIQLLMSSCGIVSSKRFKKNDKLKTWVLSINSIYIEILNRYGYCKTDKIKKINKLNDGLRYSSHEIYPDKIKDNISRWEARKRGVRVDNKHEITKEKLVKLHEAFPEIKEFERQLNQGIFWDKIVEIERIDKIEEYYDIQVSGHESYFINGIVSHNTILGCFLIPIFQALEEPERFRYYLNIQNTSTKAIILNTAIRTELEVNEILREVYGDQVNSEKWTEKQFIMKNGTIFCGIGASESVRGINYNNIRPDYIVVDDLYDDEDSYNIKRVEKKENWFWGTIYQARAQTKTCSFHIQGTAISRNDLLHQCAKMEGVVYRKFQAIIDEPKRQTLWLDWDSLVEDKKRMGSIRFAKEMMNECRDDETAVIKESWIQYYEYDLYRGTDHKNYINGEEITKILLGVDPAIGEKDINDSTGKALIYRTSNYNYYIHKVWNDHLTFNDNIKHMEKICKEERVDIVRFEAISGFKAFVQEIKRASWIPLKEINAVGDKLVRLETQSSKFENNKVYVNANMPTGIRNLLVEQLINNYPQHDDIRDACFVAGTKVATVFGDKSIEDIKYGDMVITPFGLRRVTVSACTGRRQVMTNIGLTGTPEHKVFTFGGKFVEMDTVINRLEGDELCLKRLIRWRLQKMYSLWETSISGLEGKAGIISVAQLLMKSEEERRGFMWLSGNMLIRLRFLKTTKFIIKTITILTTTVVTWSVYRLMNIRNSTLESLARSKRNIWGRCRSLLKAGIEARKAVSGTRSMGAMYGMVGSTGNTFAMSAAINSRLETKEEEVIVPLSAGKGKTAESVALIDRRLAKRVSYVVQNLVRRFQLSGRAKLRHVAEGAEQRLHTEAELVYNITVDRDHVYYANGLLVANCVICLEEKVGLTPSNVKLGRKMDWLADLE